MIRAAKKNIFDVKPYVPGKPIEEVKRELGLRSVVKLASNESPFGPSPKVLRAMTSAVKQVNRYPDGHCHYLRNALSKKLGVAENQLIFGNGSDEVIVLTVRAFVGPGDEIIVARPSFLIYEIASKLEGAVVRYVPLKNFHYDLEAMLKAVTDKTKIVFIGNPDNPAGTFITESQAENFLKNLRSDIVVLFDEAYFEYVQGQRSDYPDTVRLMRTYKNVVTTRTFSKMYGLAGLRVGYGIAATSIIDILNRLREPFNVNAIAQEAALACLKDGAYYRKLAGKIEAQRKFLIRNFNALKVPFVETVTNFMLINVGSDSTQTVRRLMDKGVIVRDMCAWGLKGYIRVTIGTKEENQKFIKALKGVL